MFSRKPGQMNLPFGVLAEPVDVEDARRLAELALHLDPVAEIVAHVIAAEGQHRHGIAANFADGARGGRRHFRAHGGADVNAGAPVESLDRRAAWWWRGGRRR